MDCVRSEAYIQLAVENNDVEGLKCLLQLLDVSDLDLRRVRPWYKCMSAEVVKLLLDTGVLDAAAQAAGRKALYRAVCSSDLELVATLLKGGISPVITDGRSPAFSRAVEMGNRSIIAQFLSHPEININGFHGFHWYTLLGEHIYKCYTNFDVDRVRFLLDECGADVNAPIVSRTKHPEPPTPLEAALTNTLISERVIMKLFFRGASLDICHNKQLMAPMLESLRLINCLLLLRARFMCLQSRCTHPPPPSLVQWFIVCSPFWVFRKVCFGVKPYIGRQVIRVVPLITHH